MKYKRTFYRFTISSQDRKGNWRTREQQANELTSIDGVTRCPVCLLPIDERRYQEACDACRTLVHTTVNCQPTVSTPEDLDVVYYRCADCEDLG